VAAGLREHPRVGGIRQPEARRIPRGCISPKRPSSRSAWTNSSGWRASPILSARIPPPCREELVDGLDDHAEHLAIAIADRRIGKQVLLETVPNKSCLATLCSGSRPDDAVSEKTADSVAFI